MFSMEGITWKHWCYLWTFLQLYLAVYTQIVTKCDRGSFGKGCKLTCHCADGADCFNTRGRCDKGCATPWAGSSCQKKNVAYTKPTFQSSTLRSLGATYLGSRAVDGNKNWPACSHSERELNPYWTVDLVLPTTVYSARIHNRNDCCQQNLKGFQVFVSNSRDLTSATLCYTSPSWTTPEVTIDFSCTTPVIGRYVSIVVPRLDSLVLCDVEIYECADYTFGRGCVGECHCKNELEICDKRSGTCKSGCAAGWTGTTCQTVCPDFKFGEDCKINCQCQQYNEVCDKVTGFCRSGCLPGLGGVGCQAACSDLSFGSNCDRQCRCLDNSEVCDKITGACVTGCAPGWSGSDCSTACAAGTYGVSCRSRCRCSDPTEVCDSITGFCSTGCATGWTGNRCHVECQDGYFGVGCRRKCNCYDPTEVCDKKTGSCLSGCSGDSRGESCSECPQGRFGPACDMECQCHNATEQCDRTSGFCRSGCHGTPAGNICLSKVRGSAEGLSAEAVGGIIGGIVGVLLVLMAVILVCLSKRNSSKFNRPSSSMYENCTPDFLEAQSTPPVNASFDNQSTYENVEALYENCREVTPEADVMDAEALFDYIQGFLSDPEGLEAAFKEIPVPLSVSNEALQPWNLKKNRYRHVLPFDDCRVLLVQREGEDASDYINASYIDGFQKPKAYIATQGPTPVMMEDFWQMIWQEKCGKIVMLTNLMEMGRIKCDQYWPDEGSKKYGEIDVEHLSTEDFAHFTVRSFKLSKASDVKTVTQFHFRSWSDHDAPDDTTGILHFRDKIRDTNVETEGPTVVHCSAGVGRTGTYIALDTLIEKAQKEGAVDIDNCVLNMRKQRMHMIQNPTQYEFLHKALRDAILCHNSSIAAGKFLGESVTDLPGTQARIAGEFLALGKYKALETRQKERVTEKKSKNRSEDIIAPDSHRVFLSTNVPDRTNYINAIFVPSFYKKQGLIVTQTPLTATVVDFWRLVYEQRCCTIVRLQEDPNEDQDQYWPQEAEDLITGPFRISLDDTSSTSSTVTTRTLGLHYLTDQGAESMTIRQFCFADWKAGEVSPSCPESLISLLELVEDWHRESDTQPTIVHCLNGAFRCGIYAAANMILERLKSEHVVNVMQTVHQLRAIRPQFIYSPEQYSFCYEVAKAFLQNFHGYQNYN